MEHFKSGGYSFYCLQPKTTSICISSPKWIHCLNLNGTNIKYLCTKGPFACGSCAVKSREKWKHVAGGGTTVMLSGQATVCLCWGVNLYLLWLSPHFQMIFSNGNLHPSSPCSVSIPGTLTWDERSERTESKSAVCYQSRSESKIWKCCGRPSKAHV